MINAQIANADHSTIRLPPGGVAGLAPIWTIRTKSALDTANRYHAVAAFKMRDIPHRFGQGGRPRPRTAQPLVKQVSVPASHPNTVATAALARENRPGAVGASAMVTISPLQSVIFRQHELKIGGLSGWLSVIT
jgi:hypothetical protein